MKLHPDFELVDIADEHMLVPVGNAAESFAGVVMLSDAGAFLVEKIMNRSKSKSELVQILLEEFDLSREQAANDVEAFIEKLIDLQLIDTED